MSKQYHRERLTLDTAFSILGWSWKDKPRIIFDPTVTHQYRRVESCRHDGTLLFSRELLNNALKPLIDLSSYYKPNGICPDDCIPVYTIGYIRRAVVYGRVDLPGVGNVPGQREGVIIPVKCDYVKLDEFIRQ